MKRYLTALLFIAASLTAISASAGAPSYFIPTEPTVTAPADQSIDVEVTPTLTSSSFQFTESYEPNNDPALSASKWLVYQPNESVALLTGEKSSSSAYYELDFKYDIPFAITISGQLATKIRVKTYSAAKVVELLSATIEKLASALFETNAFYFQPDMNFIVVKKFTDSLFLQWNLINSQGVEVTAEFVLLNGGENNSDIFGWRMTPNEYTNPIFDAIGFAAGCKVSVDNTNTSYNGYDKDLDVWKRDLSNNYDKFFLACTSKPAATEGEYAIQLKELNIVDVTNFLPEINYFSSATESLTLSDAERLKFSTEYTAQVQHIGAFDQLSAVSSWSTPISFTTRAADTNYQVTAPADLAFTAGVAKDLGFKVANTGSEAGAPQVTIRLPFEAFNIVNGVLKDFFNVSIGGQDCEMTQSAGKTDFVCQLDSLAAAAEVQLAAKITVEDDSVKSIEYQVCDLDKCDDTAFTAINITVTTPTDPAPTDSVSSSSSSGGSMFWLFFMAPLLLIRRK